VNGRARPATDRVRRLGEAGSALVEFVFLAVLVMVPLFYLVMTLARVQAGAYAASTAAREAGRAFVTATSSRDATSRAEAAARISFSDQGFGPSQTQLTIRCDAWPCLRPESRVEMSTVVKVQLPLVPSFARAVVPLEVPVRASHLAVVDRFRGAP
jgi:hypothetical protein